MARILVADKGPERRHLMQTALESAGHSVLLANGYDEALRLGLAEKPDVVVMDLLLDTESYPVRVVQEARERGGGCLGWLLSPFRKPQLIERRLPYATGCALIREVRAQTGTAATRFLPLVYEWAWAGWYGCEDSDVDVYLTAPFSPQELLDFVARVLALDEGPPTD